MLQARCKCCCSTRIYKRLFLVCLHKKKLQNVPLVKTCRASKLTHSKSKAYGYPARFHWYFWVPTRRWYWARCHCHWFMMPKCRVPACYLDSAPVSLLKAWKAAIANWRDGQQISKFQIVLRHAAEPALCYFSRIYLSIDSLYYEFFLDLYYELPVYYQLILSTWFYFSSC